MSRVYSERFVHVSGPGKTLSYGVPLGFRAVVKGIAIGYYLSPNSLCWLGVAGKWVFLRSLPGETGGVFQDLRAVAYGGETVTIATSGLDVAAHCSGYLFSDDPSRSAPPAATQLPAAEYPPGWESVPSP